MSTNKQQNSQNHLSFDKKALILKGISLYLALKLKAKNKAKFKKEFKNAIKKANAQKSFTTQIQHTIKKKIPFKKNQSEKQKIITIYNAYKFKAPQIINELK